jgi:dihydroorotate dehydrogenase (fumarate)
MADLQTTYMGFSLKTPVIVSSCGLTSSLEKMMAMERYGAGAVVLKSLFEEQINMEASAMALTSDYPEALDYIRNYTKSNSLDEYLSLVEKARESLHIPVIASIHCSTVADWTRFARKIESAGAHAIELNVFSLPIRPETQTEDIENIYLSLAENIRKQVTIPIAFKLGPYFTNVLQMAGKLYHRKINGLVLFNRFYEPDINVNTLDFTAAKVFSTPDELRHSLRWVGLVCGTVEHLDVAASTGIHSGEAVVKQILAGAKAGMVCSVLYKKGLEQIQVIVNELAGWMDKKGYKTIDSFRGKMSYKNIPDPTLWERSQFMKYFSSHV